MRTLIVNADDYGLSPAVSAGILDCARGVVRSTTVLANFVTVEEADALRQSGLACGAHLNISAGPPLTAYPRALLNASGEFDKDMALDPETWQDDGYKAAAAAEWAAQLSRLYQLKLPVGHLDSHHHTHMLGELLGEAVRFARGAGLPLRSRHLMREYIRDAQVLSPDDLVETFFGAANLTRAHLLDALSHSRGDVVELMCHPGHVDNVLRQRSGYVSEREVEISVLADPALAEELGRLGWRLDTYAALLR